MPKYFIHLYALHFALYVTCTPGPDRTPRYDDEVHNLPQLELSDFMEQIEPVSEEKIKKIQASLKDKNKKWEKRGFQPGSELYSAYMATIPYPKNGQLQQGYNAWKNFISNPSDMNKDQLVNFLTAIKKENRNLLVPFYKHSVALLNDTKRPLTKAQLAYLDYLMFIGGKYCSLHKKIKEKHALLRRWQQEQKTLNTGVLLWQKASQLPAIQTDDVYKIAANQRAIAKCFEKLDAWASVDSVGSYSYNMSVEDIEVTIPNGLAKLKWIVDELDMQQNPILKKLTIYINKVAAV